MTGFTLPGIPGELAWNDRPLGWQAGPGNRLVITAGERTNWFIDPAGTRQEDNAPGVVFGPPDQAFLLSAKVCVEFASTFDAGVLQLRSRADLRSGE